MFENGMKVVRNTNMTNRQIWNACSNQSTHSDLIDMILNGQPLTIAEAESDGKFVQVEEYHGDAPWFPGRVVQPCVNKLMKEVTEL